MKKKILLLASVTLLLASCGTKYTLKGDEKTTLTLGGSSFSLVGEYEGLDLVFTQSGKAEKGEEGQHVLTVTSTSIQLEEGAELTAAQEFTYKAALSLSYSSDDIESIFDGKKVTKKLQEEDYYTIKIKVDDEAKTYTVVYF